MKLPDGSIKTWVDLEKLFLPRFFEDDTEISVPTLFVAKQKKRESINIFVERFRSMVLRCPSGMTQTTLVETCHHNLQTSLLMQMGVGECRTWKQLVLQGVQVEEIIAKVRAEEKENKSRPDKPTWIAPELSPQPRRRDTLTTEVKSPSKTQSVRGGMARGQACANKLYSFKDEQMVSLFKLLQKSNKLKLSEVRRLEEVGKTNDPSYCLYHRMLGYPIKNCYIFNDILQALIDAEVLKLHPKQKVTTNITTTSPLQFGRDLPLSPTSGSHLKRRTKSDQH